MRLSVFRYRVWDKQDRNQPQIAPFYAVREYIEQLEGVTIIEEDFLEVDESDLDIHGRIAAN
ncbi:hypothetical protein [Polynucleobacter hallstattensis]|uniref:hypothetical protein n=1 Tax=Polynucleobacter hallstattensis TaxID=1855586 RepID=UPI001C0E0E86|nr:hypothetical protein [Polynucleobacter hallstattensis]MBU3560051.1 hypothetical protein [Polynucleobacter hallstattensis]MBU3561296.1 hypothetical protein [Polynucleobacter hallstattensis]